MFKKFSREESVSSLNLAKSSVARGVKAKIGEQYPYLEENELLDVLMPKKAPMYLAKCQGHMGMVVVDGQPMFFSNRDGTYFPTLRLLHKYPDMMAKLRVDRGAIKFVLSGANIMCPGLTSPGATIHDHVDNEAPVAIFAEGKEHALAVGLTTMSTKDILAINKGVGVETMHYLNDGLWKITNIDI
mmetsp:Transcript_23820/g.28758  ORF Transcript_23820/g.28758 Transcript_23820/m.28758 type:complete len:186 (-) Transcript_23820:567-1124(-)|eukprot:CAMPEP_0197853790 /NCGR_PEP_ID=MMETSP1438-20131217/23437_1 /TAXON_ID=1461541 /ORGANISM="Pterosperma sp., Strain CCMP1384" /LENGTH=185 /DNA_ID=CAMNT_0043468319 /DNA_START=202 /DNA_END=759 /DNA_ORIENTATION=-